MSAHRSRSYGRIVLFRLMILAIIAGEGLLTWWHLSPVGWIIGTGPGKAIIVIIEVLAAAGLLYMLVDKLFSAHPSKLKRRLRGIAILLGILVFWWIIIFHTMIP